VAFVIQSSAEETSMENRPEAPARAIAAARPKTAPPTRERSTRRLLLAGSPDFWRLWSVGLVVFSVRWLETVAVSVFVYQHSRSAFLVAMMTMLRLLPMGLFGAFIGAWAEKIERRITLILVVAMMLTTSASLALLAYSGQLAIWHLAVASFLNGLGWATDNPVRRVMIGEVVGGSRMSIAMSLDVGANNASRMVGPTVGGLMLASAGIGGIFILSVALYAFAMYAAVRVRYRNAASFGSASVLARIAEGLRLVRNDRRLVGTLVVTIIYNVFGWPFTSMIPVIGQNQLGLGAEGIGILASIDGIGAFCGALLLTLFLRPAGYARAYLGGVATYMVMLIVFALAPSPAMAGGALLFTGLGGAGFSTMQATLVYLAAPAEMRSRILGVLSVCIGIGPIGFVALGLLADAIGAQWATTASGSAGLLCLALTRKLWRHV
jgi:MFS family permease